MVRTWHVHCQGSRFNPRSANKDPTSHVAWPKKKGKRKIKTRIKLVLGQRLEKGLTLIWGRGSFWFSTIAPHLITSSCHPRVCRLGGSLSPPS